MKPGSFAKFVIASVLAVLATSPTIYSQYSQKNRETLTNAKIVEMHKLGLGDEIIVAKINQSDCQCDTSSAALAKLQAAKISQKIIMAMLDATASYSDSAPAKGNGTVVVTKPIDETPDAGPKELRDIAEPGIYLFENGKMTTIEPTVFSGSSMNTWKSSMTLGIKKAKYKAKVMGSSANTQVNNPQPVFYFVFSLEYKRAGAAMAGFYGLGATSPNEFILLTNRPITGIVPKVASTFWDIA